jgi:NADH-quinone oxidoreductase subunit G
VVGGVDPADLPDPHAAVEALDAVGFLVSLEVRSSAVTSRADVVLPVAPVPEKAGTFLDWEGRWRFFEQALSSSAMSDYRVLDSLADLLDVPLGLRGAEQVRGELAELDAWEGTRAGAPAAAAMEPPVLADGEAVLATWHLLLDGGRMQDGEPYLAGTAHRAVARMSPATAALVGATDAVTVTTAAGSVTVPLQVTDMAERVVWLPTNSTGCAVRERLRADSGSVVTIAAAAAATPGTGEL